MNPMCLKIFRVFIVVIFLAGLICPAWAETVYLRTGKKVAGKMLEQSDDFVVLDVDGVSLRFYNDEFSKITNEDPEPVIESNTKTVESFKVTNATIQKAQENMIASEKKTQIVFYLKDLYILDLGLEAQLDEMMNVFLSLNKASEKGEAMQVVLDGVEAIEQVIQKVRNKYVPEDIKKIQSVAIKYYESMLAVQSSVLKVLSDPEGKRDQIDLATAKMVEWEEIFYNEFKGLLKDYKITDIYIRRNILRGQYFSTLDKDTVSLIEENRMLHEETRKLIQANKNLHADTMVILQENQQLKRELLETLQMTLNKMEHTQKKELLNYLNK